MRLLKLYKDGLKIPDTFSRSRIDREATLSLLRRLTHLKRAQPLLKSVTGVKSIRSPVPIQDIGSLLINGIKDTQNRRMSKYSRTTM